MAAQRSIHHLVFVLSLFRMIPLVASDCYWPDGSDAFDQHECYGTDGADGLCCAEGDLCLLNHLCQVNGTTATFYRGACSMPGDTTSTCATICNDSDSGSNLSGEQSVGQCSGASNEFYCDTDKAADSNCTNFASSAPVYTLSGCLEVYNTAGSATVLTVSPTCSATPVATTPAKKKARPNAARPSGSHPKPTGPEVMRGLDSPSFSQSAE